MGLPTVGPDGGGAPGRGELHSLEVWAGQPFTSLLRAVSRRDSDNAGIGAILLDRGVIDSDKGEQAGRQLSK